MKKIIALLLVLCMSIYIVACGEEIPPLEKPISLLKAYYTVQKGDISDVDIFDGFISPESTSYFYAEDGVVASSDFVLGSSVKKGDTVIFLNESIDKDIEKLEKKIATANDISSIYVDEHKRIIANERAGLNGLTGFDRENKALDIEALENKFAYEEETRKAELLNAAMELDNLKLKKESSEVVADKNGVISYINTVLPDTYVKKGDLAFIISDSSKFIATFGAEVNDKLQDYDSYLIKVGASQFDNVKNIEADTLKPAKSEFLLDKTDGINIGDYCALYAYYNIASNVLYVPNETVQYNKDEDTYYVLKKGEDGDTKVPVTKGIQTKYYTEIKEGLSSGDEIYYAYDETTYGVQYNYEKAFLGDYVHTTVLNEVKKYGLEYVDVLGGAPGKIGSVYIENPTDAYIEKDTPLFSVFPKVEQSKYEEVKNDYEICIRDYDVKVKNYENAIKEKETAYKEATNQADKLMIKQELDELKDGMEQYMLDLDEEKEELTKRYEDYTSWLNGEEVVIKAPITGVFNATINIVTGAEIGRKDVVGNMYEVTNSLIYINDSNNVAKYGNSIRITSSVNGDNRTANGKVCNAFNVYEDNRASGIVLKCESDQEFIDLYSKMAEATVNDISISNVVMIPKNCLYKDSNYYVYLSYNGYIVKKNVVPGITDYQSDSLVWIKDGLNPGDIVVDYE